jgi:hypothetical protein
VIVAMEDVTRANLERWVKTDGYDAVLVARLVDVKKETTYQPPTYTDLYGYWGAYGGYVAQPGYVLETTTLLVETTLFDASTGKVVYSAESETFQPRSRDAMIGDLVPLLVGDLTKRGMLATES